VTPKRERQQRIAELIARNRVGSHDELLDLLIAEGISTTQSTLSRDLREIGVVKGPDGYRQIGPGSPRPNVLRDLARSIRPLLQGWDTGGNIVVLRPARSDGAVEISARVSEARAPEVVASLACDGTVLVVARTPAQARELARRLG
jgi:transcriptional regulator of arginine metabolism